MADDVRNPQHGSSDFSAVPFHQLFSFNVAAADVALIIIGTLGAFVAGTPLPIIAAIFGTSLDDFAGHQQTDPADVLKTVSKASFQTFLVGVGSSVGFFVEMASWMTIGERQAARIRDRYLRALLQQDISFWDTEISSGEIVEKMSGDTTRIQQATGEKAGRLLQLLSTFVCGFVIGFSKGWKMALVVVSGSPLIVGVGLMVSMLVSRTSARFQLANAEACNVVEQAVSAIRTVVAFTSEKREIQHYENILKRADEASMKQALVSGVGLGTVLFFTFGTYSLTFWYGSWLLLHDHGYSGGTVVTILFTIIIGCGAVGQAPPNLTALAAGRAAAYRMFVVINRVSKIKAYSKQGMILTDLQGDVDLQDINFSYPSRPDCKIFSGLSIRFPKCTSTAIVGESGTGKSTVISLIERFYDPQDGSILIDGIDIKALQLRWLRKQIGLVPQNPLLLGISVKDNIAFGRKSATFKQIEAAAKLANAENFIKQLPKGYDTVVGQQGTLLSGGQKQRLAIARAILKNPRILLLDEATSSLDANSERVVMWALERVMKNRTTVIVAHRLSTIKKADMIVVLKHGTIVERGSHEELQGKNGAYAGLIQLQSLPQVGRRMDELQAISRSPRYYNPRLAAMMSSFKPARSPLSTIPSKAIAPPQTNIGITTADAPSPNAVSLRSWLISCFPGAHAKTNSADVEMGDSKISPKRALLLRLASIIRPEAPVLILGSLASVVHGAIMPTLGILLANMMTTLYEPHHHLRVDSLRWVKMFLIMGCISLVVAPIQIISFNFVGMRLVRRIRLLMFDKITRQEMAWFDAEENSSGALASRLSTDAAEVRNVVGDALALLVQNLATILTGLTISFALSWRPALVYIASLPFLSLEEWAQVKLMKMFAAETEAENEEPNQVAHDAVSSIRTIVAFCAEGKILKMYRRKMERFRASGRRRAIVSGTGVAVSNLLMCSSFAITFWFGCKFVVNQTITANAYLQTFFCIQLSAIAVAQSTAMAPDVSKMKMAVTSVFGVIDRRSQIDAADSRGITIQHLKGDIEYRHVWFAYPTRPDSLVLKDLCLKIEAGKTMALVGESGCGKSTIMALIQRFYNVGAGEIMVDGRVELRRIRVGWWRQQVAVVDQDACLMDGSIKDNILYGCNRRVGLEEEMMEHKVVKAAARVANLTSFIDQLPAGYHTTIGAHGLQLSGGQRQRLAIARAVARDATILLLDEATSSLDAESEHAIQDALSNLLTTSTHTTLLVAHRLSTIRSAHRIAVLKNGTITEFGTHDTLSHLQNGAYASLLRFATS